MTAVVLAAPAPPRLNFFTLAPCRVVDTRSAGGPLVAGVERTFSFVGPCGIPATALAVSVNVAVTQPTTAGNVRLYPAGSAVPTSSTINYSAGQTRTNNTVVGLDAAGALAAQCLPAGSTHLIVDVNGYFEGLCPAPTQSCYTGPPGTLFVGICHPGTQTCVDGNFGPCLNEVTPIAETCNGVDDDCDGVADNGNPGGGASCNSGLLGVCAAGTVACSGGALVCSPGILPGTLPEVCNGEDDNCDGATDEGCP